MQLKERWIDMRANRQYRLLAAPMLYLCLGFFWVRHEFIIDGSWSLGVMMLGLGAVLGGLLQERFNSARVAYLGAALFALGFVGTGWTSTSMWRYLTLDILIGGGSGIAYSAGIPMVARWFPDKVGLAIGAAVAGYVPAGFVGRRLAPELIVMMGWRTAAQVTGLALFIIAVAAVWLLRPSKADEPAFAAIVESGPMQMIRTPAFQTLWLSYALATTGAAITSTVLPDYVSHVAAQQGAAGASAAVHLLGPVSHFANAGSRLVAGTLCDLLGGFRVLGLGVAAIPLAAFLAPSAQPPPALLAVAFADLGGYGAMLAIYPILTVTVFGLRHLGANYGLVFSAWASGCVTGTLLGPSLVRNFGAYAAAFYGAALISLVAFWLARRTEQKVRQPEKRQHAVGNVSLCNRAPQGS